MAAANGDAFGRGMGNDFGVPDKAPAYDATAEYAKGKAALQVGDFRAAERDFDNSLSVDRDNPDTLFMLGTARAGGGDLRGAVRAYEKSLRFNDKSIIVRREYAVALARLGQADKAQAQLAILKARSDACGGTCSEAADLNAAMTAVQAAMPPPGAATSGHS